jgi:hypothetical protein
MNSLRSLLFGGLAISLHLGTLAAQKVEPRLDPVITSLHPFTLQRGTSIAAVIRGSGLRGASTAFLNGAPLNIEIEAVEPEPAGSSRRPADLVRVRITAQADAKSGRYSFRLITPHGVSNALPVHIAELPVELEPPGSHETPGSAVRVRAAPAVYSGRLNRRGESDYYAFDADAGQTLTFEVLSGLPQIAAGGSAATIANFDPSITIYEMSAGWFDDRRPKRIAYSDEPEFIFGKSTDAHLIHRFDRAGTFLLRVDAFAGQGGPDYGYQLKVLPGEAPQDLAAKVEAWEERSYTRTLATNRLNQLAARSGGKPDKPSIETYRAASLAEPAPVFKLPAMLEGTLAAPLEAHHARFELTEPRDIAIEVETPGIAPPYFNPIVRLLDSRGEEVATNVMAGRGACSGALTKSLQAKTIIPLRNLGAYTVEIRDALAENSASERRYRVQVRPQVPHVGVVRIDADVNLMQGEAKTVRVTFDREEDYRGGVVVIAESLPPGVQAATGADFEEEKDDPERVGKRERYVPRSERTVLVLSASPDAPRTSEPQMARIVVRPLAGGKLGEPLSAKTIPVMVTAKP